MCLKKIIYSSSPFASLSLFLPSAIFLKKEKEEEVLVFFCGGRKNRDNMVVFLLLHVHLSDHSHLQFFRVFFPSFTLTSLSSFMQRHCNKRVNQKTVEALLSCYYRYIYIYQLVSFVKNIY